MPKFNPSKHNFINPINSACNPNKNNKPLKIHAIGCLHGFLPILPGGDILIVTGDLTTRDELDEHIAFYSWLKLQEYEYKIVVYGNHDKWAEIKWQGCDHEELKKDFLIPLTKNIFVLNNSSCKCLGLKFWGSANSLWFHGIHPSCKAFMLSESGLNKVYKKIPEDIDIIISHGPMHGVLDMNIDKKNCGSISLKTAIDKIQPKILIHSHIHEAYGKCKYKHNMSKKSHTDVYNVSIMDETYNPKNKYTEIEVDRLF